MATGVFLKGKLLDSGDQGNLVTGPVRVYAIHWVSTVAGGSVDLKDGSGTGTRLIQFDTPAAPAAGCISLVDNGVKFNTGVFVQALTDGSITLFYDPPQ